MTRRLFIQAKVSSLALGVAMVAGPSPAAAQSLQGTPTVSFGSANISEGATTTTVTVDTSQTVIDWAPDDNAVGNFGAINFQPADAVTRSWSYPNGSRPSGVVSCENPRHDRLAISASSRIKRTSDAIPPWSA